MKAEGGGVKAQLISTHFMQLHPKSVFTSVFRVREVRTFSFSGKRTSSWNWMKAGLADVRIPFRPIVLEGR